MNHKLQEVWFNTDTIAKIDDEMIKRLIAQAKQNPRQRMRLCLHRSLDDDVHEMLIALAKGCYVRPHKHPLKTESFHIIAGNLWLIIFDDQGRVVQKFRMSEKGREGYFLYRLEKNLWHTVIPISDYIVFHEVTKGPFTGQGDSVFPSWAPSEDDAQGIKEFQKKLSKA